MVVEGVVDGFMLGGGKGDVSIPGVVFDFLVVGVTCAFLHINLTCEFLSYASRIFTISSRDSNVIFLTVYKSRDTKPNGEK